MGLTAPEIWNSDEHLSYGKISATTEYDFQVFVMPIGDTVTDIANYYFGLLLTFVIEVNPKFQL